MTDSYESEHHRDEKFVDDGMLLQMKITLTNLQNKNTSTTKTNGGLIQINKVSNTMPLTNRSDFKQAMSTLERLHQEAGEEQFAPIPYWKNKQCKSASSSSSTWWEWQGSWWFSYKSESQE